LPGYGPPDGGPYLYLCLSPPAPLRFGQRFRHGARTPCADHLGRAFLVGRAVDDAIGTGAALAIGAAVIALGVLRESAAGFGAGVLELVGARLG